MTKELNRYGQRLSWHIQRLYRVRNSISHSRETDDNIVSLVEHLHSYVDEVILDILSRIAGEQKFETIDNVLLDAQVFIGNLTRDYSNNDELTPSDVQLLLK